MRDIVAICESAEAACESVPVLNAYVGGALDFVAVLAEQTEYLEPVYCRSPREFFDVAAIIRFVVDRQAGNEARNAMALMLRYLEVEGGCGGDSGLLQPLR
ncbi:MAG: hypothetical protein AAF648_15870 [Pseudomonadota bacterium]